MSKTIQTILKYQKCTESAYTQSWQFIVVFRLLVLSPYFTIKKKLNQKLNFKIKKFQLILSLDDSGDLGILGYLMIYRIPENTTFVPVGHSSSTPVPLHPFSGDCIRKCKSCDVELPEASLCYAHWVECCSIENTTTPNLLPTTLHYVTDKADNGLI